MRIISITTKFAVMGQPQEGDFTILADIGTRWIINNRTDNEEPHQRHSSSEAREASQAAIKYLHLPIRIENITGADIDGLRYAIATADGLVVAHCRTGVRPFILWSIAEVLAGHLQRDALLSFGAARGFDLTAAVAWLRANG